MLNNKNALAPADAKPCARFPRIASALVLTGSLLASANTLAKDELKVDSGAWLQAVGETSLKYVDPSLKDIRVWVEGQSRFDQDFSHWYQGMTRTALGYSLSDRATVWVGYTWLPTENVGKPYSAQQDLWPAFRYVLPTDFGTFMFRTMVETNFLPYNHGDVRIRPRQMIRFMHPFEFENRLSFITWDEFFVRVNSTKAGGQSGFDQNRAFAGLGWSFTPNVRTELGYMNQYVEDNAHAKMTMRNLVMASLFVNF